MPKPKLASPFKRLSLDGVSKKVLFGIFLVGLSIVVGIYVYLTASNSELTSFELVSLKERETSTVYGNSETVEAYNCGGEPAVPHRECSVGTINSLSFTLESGGSIDPVVNEELRKEIGITGSYTAFEEYPAPSEPGYVNVYTIRYSSSVTSGIGIVWSESGEPREVKYSYVASCKIEIVESKVQTCDQHEIAQGTADPESSEPILTITPVKGSLIFPSMRIDFVRGEELPEGTLYLYYVEETRLYLCQYAPCVMRGQGMAYQYGESGVLWTYNQMLALLPVIVPGFGDGSLPVWSEYQENEVPIWNYLDGYTLQLPTIEVASNLSPGPAIESQQIFADTQSVVPYGALWSYGSDYSTYLNLCWKEGGCTFFGGSTTWHRYAELDSMAREDVEYYSLSPLIEEIMEKDFPNYIGVIAEIADFTFALVWPMQDGVGLCSLNNISIGNDLHYKQGDLVSGVRSDLHPDWDYTFVAALPGQMPGYGKVMSYGSVQCAEQTYIAYAENPEVRQIRGFDGSQDRYTPTSIPYTLPIGYQPTWYNN